MIIKQLVSEIKNNRKTRFKNVFFVIEKELLLVITYFFY